MCIRDRDNNNKNNKNGQMIMVFILVSLVSLFIMSMVMNRYTSCLLYTSYMAALKDIPTRATTQKINHLLDILSLSDVKKKKISNLSEMCIRDSNLSVNADPEKLARVFSNLLRNAASYSLSLIHI